MSPEAGVMSPEAGVMSPDASMTTSQAGTRAIGRQLSTLFNPVRLCSMNLSGGLLTRAWKAIRARQIAQSSVRRLRVTETVSLGEKRFVAVIQVDGLQFLVGGGATNVALLAQLNAMPGESSVSFGSLLKQSELKQSQSDHPQFDQCGPCSPSNVPKEQS